MPEYPDPACVDLAPDRVCEVRSPSTRRLDLRGKRPVYAREVVAHLIGERKRQARPVMTTAAWPLEPRRLRPGGCKPTR